MRWPVARIAAGKQRRGEVEFQLVAALELLVELGLEGRVGIKPRHLVLVLVGQQLGVVARHRFGEARLARLLFGRGGPSRPAPGSAGPGRRSDSR